jgi:anaphase-promoting complex subunit 8
LDKPNAELKYRAAELLNTIPEPEVDPDSSLLSDSSMFPPTIIAQNSEPQEALLEAKEFNKYLMAKSFFECREFDRCAAVFLPESVLSGIVSATEPNQNPKGKGKAKATPASHSSSSSPRLPDISQRSLFLALYAKYLSGEKHKDEESEMVMGPQDLGLCVNKQLLTISRYLEAWFEQRRDEHGEDVDGQGWLEYL